jgi:hypothetical protein
VLDEQASSKRVAEIGVLGEVREERLVRLGNHPVVECDAVQQRDDALASRSGLATVRVCVAHRG